MPKIGDIIKSLRDEKKMSQTELAKKLNVSRSTIAMWESNERIPGEDKKEEIADFFNIDMNYLYGKTNVKNSYAESHNQPFTSLDDAMLFLIKSPVASAYGGYDLDKMSEEEIIDFANELSGIFKVIAERRKK